MICFYHNADLDGKCSAAIIRKMFPGIKLYGINYGDKFPWSDLKDNGQVIMVDFSLQPFDEMVRLSNKYPLTWIDHHKSAISDYNSKKYSKFNGHAILHEKKAGCELAWEYYFPHIPTPRAIRYLSQYDTWNFKDNDNVLPFQMGMRVYGELYPFDSTWEIVLSNNNGFVDETIKMGHVILKYQDGLNRGYVKANSIPTEIEGIPALAVNGGQFNSQVFTGVDAKTWPVWIVFIRRQGQWSVHLYSKTVDVSVIAHKHKGGGHKGAAGFQCDKLPFKI